MTDQNQQEGNGLNKKLILLLIYSMGILEKRVKVIANLSSHVKVIEMKEVINRSLKDNISARLNMTLVFYKQGFCIQLCYQLKRGLQQKEWFISMRADIEIYTGFYLLLKMIIGFKVWMLLWVAMYWQYLRIRYFLSSDTKGVKQYLAEQTDLNIASRPTFQSHCLIF
ncbi:UNKNOWN [Stylonychia lemnae]|uniref:Transmembrane protein n=1 Tax=Stylonychia lemnae TaxID=5949 RepID=A0A078AHR2_STYLE|nr:UNKNOWN [Stylonychia lemnae]|eukprot:CDW81406.1 UNKNOWN [Stylonychia lemnae]